MDDKINLTYITLDGYVEVEKYRYVYFVIIFTLYALIICSNAIIVCLIVIHQSLHEPMYIFIAALLINSTFYSTTIYPKLLLDVLSEKQIISYTMCHLQYFFLYTSGASEFILLAAMAYDRYVSICKPLQYPAIMRKTTVCVFLVLAWIVPACQVAGSSVLSATTRVCTFTLQGIFCNNSVYKLHCVSSRLLSVYGVIVLLNVAFFPMLYIVFTYTKILIISYQRCGEVRKKAAQTCLPHLLVLLNYSLFCTCEVFILRLEFDISKTVRLILTLQVVLYHPLFNPIIYGLKMKEISKRLKGLFCQVKGC
ncbi:olfactory receptor 6N2-like [Archocentrus centrarchus]|uniref:olfactory receptor 6N2-like n=1 Tax=Archocentrus centrarchus TaxID=63155 RepID=UPI0011E9D993|nr:olfactory receptor 6N2-like [Archocentrus centrarchus]